MTTEEPIEVGQDWRRNKGGAIVRIIKYDPEWDDVTYRTSGKGTRMIFGCNLRKYYTKVER